MSTHLRQFGVAIIGGGPAGMAVLLAADKDARLSELLEGGVLVVERSAQVGNGQIGNYSINSDSTGNTFLTPLRARGNQLLQRILVTPVAHRIAAAGVNAVSLCDAGELLGLIGEALCAIIRRYPQSAVMTCCTAESAQSLPDGSWQIALSGNDGRRFNVVAKNIVVATGATQPSLRLNQERVAGELVAKRWGDRLMQSGDVIGLGGLAEVAARLGKIAEPKVAILGGSTSAMSVAHALLHRVPEVRFSEGGVTVFHRRPLRVYYYTPEEALADGYTEFGPDDLCPITNRVFRLAGMRLDSRELLMQARGIGGRPPEPRLKLHQLLQHDPEAVGLIDSAHLVVAAFGYRPTALRILDGDGSEIPLFAHTGSEAPMVDDSCRLMDCYRGPIAGVFGIGLAAGFVPHDRLGGEPSFRGQANGLWLWQNDIGSIIVNSVLSRRLDASATRRVSDRPVETTSGDGLPEEGIVVASKIGA